MGEGEVNLPPVLSKTVGRKTFEFHDDCYLVGTVPFFAEK